MRYTAFLLLVLASFIGLGCDDDLTDAGQWSDVPDTVTVFSASRPEYAGQPSAFDLIGGIVLRLESPNTAGNFDLALAEQNGALVLLPSGVVEARSTRAGLAPAPAGSTFENLTSAPRDSAQYLTTGSFPVQPNQIFFVRSRSAPCAFGSGFRYAKLQTISTDPARGSAMFRFVANPLCDDRSLVAPD